MRLDYKLIHMIHSLRDTDCHCCANELTQLVSTTGSALNGTLQVDICEAPRHTRQFMLQTALADSHVPRITIHSCHIGCGVAMQQLRRQPLTSNDIFSLGVTFSRCWKEVALKCDNCDIRL